VHKTWTYELPFILQVDEFWKVLATNIEVHVLFGLLQQGFQTHFCLFEKKLSLRRSWSKKKRERKRKRKKNSTSRTKSSNKMKK